MTSTWKTIDTFSTEDSRLRVSLQSPIEEPYKLFIDIRRMFEKNGEFLNTRRGIRVSTSTDSLDVLVTTLQTMVQGKMKRRACAGICLARLPNYLRLRKADLREDETPVFVILSPTETLFLVEKLIIIRQSVSAWEVESDDDDEEEAELPNWN